MNDPSGGRGSGGHEAEDHEFQTQTVAQMLEAFKRPYLNTYPLRSHNVSVGKLNIPKIAHVLNKQSHVSSSTEGTELEATSALKRCTSHLAQARQDMECAPVAHATGAQRPRRRERSSTPSSEPVVTHHVEDSRGIPRQSARQRTSVSRTSCDSQAMSDSYETVVFDESKQQMTNEEFFKFVWERELAKPQATFHVTGVTALDYEKGQQAPRWLYELHGVQCRL